MDAVPGCSGAYYMKGRSPIQHFDEVVGSRLERRGRPPDIVVAVAATRARRPKRGRAQGAHAIMNAAAFHRFAELSCQSSVVKAASVSIRQRPTYRLNLNGVDRCFAVNRDRGRRQIRNCDQMVDLRGALRS